jgi:hypothetical protein
VLDRTQLGRDGSVTMLEVHDASGIVRRVLVGASNGSSPRLLLELGVQSSDLPLAKTLDADRVTEDRNDTLEMLKEMVSTRESNTHESDTHESDTHESDTRTSETAETAETAGPEPVSTPEPVDITPAMTGRAAVLPFERALNAALDEDPEPQPPRRRRGRWEVIA